MVCICHFLLSQLVTVLCKRLKFLESMFRKGPSCTRHLRGTHGPRYHMIRPVGLKMKQQSLNWGIHLVNSICHLLPHRAPTACLKYGHTGRYSNILRLKGYGPIARSSNSDGTHCWVGMQETMRLRRGQEGLMSLASRIEMDQPRNVAQGLVSLYTYYSLCINLRQYTY